MGADEGKGCNGRESRKGGADQSLKAHGSLLGYRLPESIAVVMTRPNTFSHGSVNP
jgi:hypothetical protein